MLVPSIDIMNGKAVQLRQGKELVLEIERDPVELAYEFNRFGEIAVIDLDAALGTGDNQALIEKICQVADVRVGGGIRDVVRGRQLLKAGAKKLILGTAATPELLGQFLPQQVMVALDHWRGEVVDRGWQQSTGESLIDRAKRLGPYCGSFLSTFVEAEGGMGGLSVKEAQSLSQLLNKPLTVAGGIANTQEVIEISRQGIDVQVGMALYTGKVDPVEAITGSINFGQGRLVPTIVQDTSGQVLMLAYSSAESISLSLKQGKGIYFSRSRQQIWEKGLTSGATQTLISCRADCDRDSLLFTVQQSRGACHTGSYSCFEVMPNIPKFSLANLFKVLSHRKSDAIGGSYSATLFKDRKKLLRKIAEESFEVRNFQSRENLRHEIADVLYFLSVLAVDEGISWAEIESELGGRRK